MTGTPGDDIQAEYDPVPRYVPPPPFAPPAPSATTPGGEGLYGEPVYLPESTGPAAYPQEPASPAPPGRRRRRTVVGVVAAVVAAVAAYAGVTALLDDDDTTPRIAVPESFAGYHRLHDATATRLETRTRSLVSDLGGPSSVGKQASVGVYAAAGSDVPNYYYFALPTGVVGGAGDATARVVDLIGPFGLSDRVTHPLAGDATMVCGNTTIGALTLTPCAWSDSRTTGVGYKLNPAGDPSEVGDSTDALRRALEP